MMTVTKPKGRGIKNFNCPDCGQFRGIEYPYDGIVKCVNCELKTKIQWE